MSAPIYLDHSATTPLLDRVRDAMLIALTDQFANPSSLHAKGLEAERLVKRSRQAIAAALGVEPNRLIFTSGATEANNWALLGAARARRHEGRHLIASAIEHASVLEPLRRLRDQEGFELTLLPVTADGRIRLEDLQAAVRPDTILVSTMAVNNEIGSVQPLAEIGAWLATVRRGRAPLIWHVDAVQAFGKLPLAPATWGVDLLTVSAHKLHGPKGIGALYLREGLNLPPLLFGGEQEFGLRPGTENVPGIAGFAAAVEAVTSADEPPAQRIGRLRERLLEQLADAFPDLHLNGPRNAPQAAPHIVNFSLPGIRGEHLVHALAEHGIFVSTGSACHSRSARVSHVIEAIRTPRALQEGSVRVSLGATTTADEIDRFTETLRTLVPHLRLLTGRRH